MSARQRIKIISLGLVLTATLSLALSNPSVFAQAAQAPAGEAKGPVLKPLPKPRGKVSGKPRGGLRIGGAPADKIRAQVEDKNAAARPNLKQVRETQFYRIAIGRPDNSLMTLNYYPALPGENPAVVLLIHEKDRSSRDFADKIEELKQNNGLAAELQNEGLAVISIDVAGLTDPRRRDAGAAKKDPSEKAESKKAAQAQTGNRSLDQAVTDLKLTYQFMVDRHNRLEFNMGKLAIVTLGEGGNAVLEWLKEATEPAATAPGRPATKVDPARKKTGAVIASGMMNTATDRPSDIAALVMVSPVERWQNNRSETTLKALVAGAPMDVFVIGGSKDKDSAEMLNRLKPIVERRESRLSKVEVLGSGLHGARFLRFEPGLLPKINRFLEQTVEFKKTEWEPRYNLNPIAYQIQEAVSRTAAQAATRKDADAEKLKMKDGQTTKPKADEKPPVVPEPPAPKPEEAGKAKADEPAKPQENKQEPESKTTEKPE